MSTNMTGMSVVPAVVVDQVLLEKAVAAVNKIGLTRLNPPLEDRRGVTLLEGTKPPKFISFVSGRE